MDSIIIQKFGGTSVKNTERIFNVANIIAESYQKGYHVLAVVSAQGDHTDELLAKANENQSKSKLAFKRPFIVYRRSYFCRIGCYGS